MSDILTPCRNICILDPACGLCRGCGRTAAEIAAWAGLDNGERARIMTLLPERLAAHGLAAARKMRAQ
jgi:predicted Fe-S protein YdhL (DUF1289 family)